MSQQEILIYMQVEMAASMGKNAIDDMLSRYFDEQFCLELMCLKNEYSIIEQEATQCIYEKKMTTVRDYIETNAQEVSSFGEGVCKDVANQNEESPAGKQLVDKLISLQKKHREIYGRFLN